MIGDCEESGVHAFCLTQVRSTNREVSQIEKCTCGVSLDASLFNTQGIDVPAR